MKRTDFLVKDEVLGWVVVEARAKSLLKEGSLGEIRLWSSEGGWPWNCE